MSAHNAFWSGVICLLVVMSVSLLVNKKIFKCPLVNGAAIFLAILPPFFIALMCLGFVSLGWVIGLSLLLFAVALAASKHFQEKHASEPDGVKQWWRKSALIAFGFSSVCSVFLVIAELKTAGSA